MTLKVGNPLAYPWRAPKPGRLGDYSFTGWQVGWKKSGGDCGNCGEEHEDIAVMARPDQRVVDEMERLRDYMCTSGWDLQWDMYNIGPLVEDDFIYDNSIAYVHIFVNGTDVGYGLRVYGDDVVTSDRGTVTPQQCLERLIELLPAHVDTVIKHFEAYPGSKKEPS